MLLSDRLIVLVSGKDNQGEFIDAQTATTTPPSMLINCMLLHIVFVYIEHAFALTPRIDRLRRFPWHRVTIVRRRALQRFPVSADQQSEVVHDCSPES